MRPEKTLMYGLDGLGHKFRNFFVGFSIVASYEFCFGTCTAGIKDWRQDNIFGLSSALDWHDYNTVITDI